MLWKESAHLSVLPRLNFLTAFLEPIPMLIFPCPSCVEGIAGRTVLPCGDLEGQIPGYVPLPGVTQGAVWEICNNYPNIHGWGEKTAKPERNFLLYNHQPSSTRRGAN